MADQIESVDPVQEKARQVFKEWEPHLHKLTPFEVAGILNDLECEYMGERHEDFCKTLHFLAFEYYMKPERLRQKMLDRVVEVKSRRVLEALKDEFAHSCTDNPKVKALVEAADLVLERYGVDVYSLKELRTAVDEVKDDG